MNIEEFINYEAGSGSENDVAYAKELRRAYSEYSGCSHNELLVELEFARRRNRLTNSSHATTADCMIIHKLLIGGLL